MKSFIFYLKRDLRLLLPLNLILFLVIVLGMGSVLILRMNISRPLETIDFSVIAFFLFFLMLVGGLIISVEALWREWRLGTQFGWYLSQGTLHLKLWSKVIAIYLWQGVQVLLTLFLFFGVAYLTSTQATVNEMLNELRLPSPFLLQLIWSTFIVPLSSIMMILLAAFLYFGLKTKWRFIYMGGYFILAVILYPYIYLKFDQNDGALTQAPFLVEILQIETMQIVLDGILFIGIYALLYWFVKNKIEL